MSESSIKDNRLYPESPTACASAVVFKEGRILMVKRANEPNKGKWSIPGGGIELGETVCEAARREVREECSIEIEIERVLDSADTIVRDKRACIKYHYVIIDLLARYTGGEIKAQSDAEECGWFTPEELAGLDMSTTLRAMLERQGIIKSVSK
jgi:ADP-ribose pyrophosphatase YjhB (NUDIX family)